MRDFREVVRQHVARARLAPPAELEVIDELSQHLEQRYADLIARGAAPDDAEREALAELEADEDLVRTVRMRRDGYSPPAPLGVTSRGSAFSGFGNDLRVAFRLLRRHRAFAVAAVLTLGIGIGATTAIFGMVDAVLLRAWPFASPADLAIVWETDRASNTTHEPASWPDIADFAERSRSVSAIAAFVSVPSTLRVAGAEPVRLSGVGVTPNFLELLGVRPIIGPGFRAEDGLYGGSGLTVVLGEALWHSRFNADSSVVGTAIVVNQFPATIVGVAPASADLGIRQVHRRADYGGSLDGARVDLWLSMQPTASQFPRSTHPFFTLARLAPRSTLADAQRELAAIAADLERAYPENDARGVNVQSLGDVIFAPVRPAMLMLLIAAALVLVVTCANVANLLLARASVRVREVAVRRALGASTARIARQLWTESLVLSVAGTIVGVALTWLALQALVKLAPIDVPRLTDAALDARSLGFAVLITGVIAVVFGGVSALRIRGFGIRAALHALPGRSTEGRGARQVRAALVVGQVALAVALFAAAGLLLRSYMALQAVDPGFRVTGVLKAEYEVPWNRYRDRREDWPNLPGINGFHANVVARMAALPGVVSAGLAGRHPLDPGYTNSFVIIGREAESRDFPEVRTRVIAPGYLSTTGVPLVAGRDIDGRDVATSTFVALINRAAVERYFPGVDPLGQQLRLRGSQWLVVGVIGDERFKGIDQESEPAVYVPLAQMPQSPVTLLVRTTRDPLAIVPQVRQTLRELDPEIPLFGVEPLEHTVAATIAPQRFTTTLLSVFSAVTVLLALIGVHGLLAYTVTQRTRELGIRMALGATRRDIRMIVLRQGVGLAVIGVAIGLVAALLGTRLVATMLFDVTPTDPVTFALVTIAVLVTAAGAAWLPARRATTVDPVEALRD